MDEENWHSKSAEGVLQTLQTSTQGLSEEEVKKRLSKFGPNELREEKKISPLTIFFGQFKEFLIIILLFATAISALVGELLDASVIFAIVIASTVLGFFQEYRAEKALETLKRMAAPTATVIRDGKDKEVPAKELVPGDILILTTGDKVVADARLIEEMNLKVDEAPLTGESIPVKKETITLREDTAVADRKNMVFAGTTVTYGRGMAVVMSTGMSTEFGKIAKMIQTVGKEKTPLEERLGHIGKWLGITCVVVCAFVSFVGILRGYGLLEMFTLGVSLAVAAVPEALPVVVTGALAIGVLRMARRNAIVRRLPAVETLGCASVICADKTGTITKNEMTVRKIYANDQIIEVTGVGYEPKGEFHRGEGIIDPKEDPQAALLLRIVALCNDARLECEENNWYIAGDPTEGALIVAAAKAGIAGEELRKRYPRIGEIPFSSERKRMSTIHTAPGGDRVAYIKGAPEVVLERCTYVFKGGRKKRLTKKQREEILKINEDMSSKALRVLGAAYKNVPKDLEEFTEEGVEKDLVLVGLVGMIDPPREEAKEAVQLCEKAGIKVVMITGDHKLTAVAVAREVGILKGGGRTLTGIELDEMTEEDFEKIVEDVAVYARVSPEHKLRIIKALKKKGHIVAMTGDGINDAPALKNSDIGVAMGITGTDVTKEASDMVLADDNFATIVAAVEEGRGIYDNIKKYLTYLLSCNVGEILVLFLASLLGFSVPLIALQILWVNLVTDGLPALALGVDTPDLDIMQRPPRDPKGGVFTRRILTLIAGISTIICLVIIAVFAWYLQMGESLVKAQTMAFTTMVMLEMFNVFNSRSEKHSIFKIGPLSNKYLVGAVAASILMQFVVLYMPPLQPIFGTVPLGLFDWMVVIAGSSTTLFAVEIGKFMRSKNSAKFAINQTSPKH